MISERFHQCCSDALKPRRRGLFDFWLRLGSVTGFSNLLLRPSLAKNQKSSLRIATSFLSTLQPQKGTKGSKIRSWRFHVSLPRRLLDPNARLLTSAPSLPAPCRLTSAVIHFLKALWPRKGAKGLKPGNRRNCRKRTQGTHALIRSLPVRFVDQTENWGFENKRREAKDAEKRRENPFLIALRSPRLCVSPGLSTNRICRIRGYEIN